MVGTDSCEKQVIIDDANFCRTYRHSRVGGKPQGGSSGPSFWTWSSI